MSGAPPSAPPAPPEDFGVLLRDLFCDASEDYVGGSKAAAVGAIRKNVMGPKAAPVRQLVGELDQAHGGLFSRAAAELLTLIRRPGDPKR